jgi:hypothetical protein
MTRRASSLLLVVAIVAVVGFMYWLERTAASLDAGVEPVLVAGSPELVEIAAEDLAADPAAAVGTSGVLRTVTVAQRLGRGAFSIQLDNTTTYPVLLSNDLIQLGTEVYGQDRVTLYGHVFTFTDSIGAEWVSQTAVDAENAAAIPATPSFLMADSLAFN